VEGLAQVNLVVTDLARAKEFWVLLGYESTPRHLHAAVLSFPNGMTLVLHEPEFARHWDPAFAGSAPGSTVVDINLSSRESVDEVFERLVGAGFRGSVEPWDTFFGARYAIVCDQDGHRVGLKSPQDPSRSYPLDE
jgi:predicted lactoylglutathione lyase